MRIAELFRNDANVDHLWAAHRVTPDEVEEIVFGTDGEPAVFRALRDGDNYKIFGETGGGRLLLMVGSFLRDGRFGYLRPARWTTRRSARTARGNSR